MRAEPLRDATVDRVLCAAILHHVDLLATAAEIRRVLKPGGVAVFLEPLAPPRPFSILNRWLPASPEVSPDEQPLTVGQVAAVSRTIGQPGPRREFGLTHRILSRAGIDWPRLIGASLRLDARVLRHWAPARALASPLVWSAHRPPTGGPTG
jgi:SAM-dependent methyltransferase